MQPSSNNSAWFLNGISLNTPVEQSFHTTPLSELLFCRSELAENCRHCFRMSLELMNRRAGELDLDSMVDASGWRQE